MTPNLQKNSTFICLARHSRADHTQHTCSSFQPRERIHQTARVYTSEGVMVRKSKLHYAIPRAWQPAPGKITLLVTCSAACEKCAARARSTCIKEFRTYVMTLRKYVRISREVLQHSSFRSVSWWVPKLSGRSAQHMFERTRPFRVLSHRLVLEFDVPCFANSDHAKNNGSRLRMRMLVFEEK